MAEGNEVPSMGGSVKDRVKLFESIPIRQQEDPPKPAPRRNINRGSLSLWQTEDHNTSGGAVKTSGITPREISPIAARDVSDENETNMGSLLSRRNDTNGLVSDDNFSDIRNSSPNTEDADADVTFNMLGSVHRNKLCSGTFFRVEVSQTESTIRDAQSCHHSNLGNVDESNLNNAVGGAIGPGELRPHTARGEGRNTLKHMKMKDHIEDYQIIQKKLHIAQHETCVKCNTKTMKAVKDSDKKILMYHCTTTSCTYGIGADDSTNYYDLVPVLQQALCSCGTDSLTDYQFSVRNGKKQLMCKNCDMFLPDDKQPCCVEITCYCAPPGIDSIMLYWTAKEPSCIVAICCTACNKFSLVGDTFIGAPEERVDQLKNKKCKDIKKESLSVALDTKGVPRIVAALAQADTHQWVDPEGAGSKPGTTKDNMPIYIEVKAGDGGNELGIGELRPAATAMYGPCIAGASLISSLRISSNRDN